MALTAAALPKLAWRCACPALECAGKIGGSQVAYPDGDFRNAQVAILQVLLGLLLAQIVDFMFDGRAEFSQTHFQRPPANFT